MTESDWLVSTDPAAMLQYLCPDMGSPYAGGVPHRISSRKLRLFACACCRQVWHLLTDERSRKAVEVGERYADGEATEGELTAAWDAAWDAVNTAASATARDAASATARAAARNSARAAARDAVNTAARAAAWGAAKQQQVHLLRDIVGNPFRPVVLHRHSLYRTGDADAPDSIKDRNGWVVLDMCRTCGRAESELDNGCPYLTPTVRAIARRAYEERPGRKCGRCNGRGYTGRDREPCSNCLDGPGFGTGRIEDGLLDPDTLSVLADALEDAGCPEEVECAACNGGGNIEHGDSGVMPWGGYDLDWIKCEPCGGTGRVLNPILQHLRSPGPHVRGDWVVDLVLGKE